jgi:uncharacterized damage-inducible protein DinB
MEPADREVLDHFTRTRRKTMDLVDRIPDEWLSRTAPGEGGSLGEVLMHVANGPLWWLHSCMRDGMGWTPQPRGPFDKDQIRRALEESLARMLEFFEAEDGARLGREFSLPKDKAEGRGAWTGRNRVLYLADHEVHHRGKIVLALRQWGMREIPFIPFE